MPLSNKKHNAAVAAEQQNLAASGALGGAPGAGAAAKANANLPGPAPFTAGPHRHDIMNKLDPTVDSGTGGMQVLTGGAHNNAGFPGQQPVGGHMPAGGGVMGSNNPYGAQHNSRMANALDPRVDFTQGQAGGANYYTKGTNVVPGAAAQPRNVPEGTYGPHSSRMANAADPRVDSDADRHRTRGVGGGVGAGGVGAQSNAKPIFPAGVAGPAPTTAGPHRHDILNKLDPSVDSRSAANVDATGRRLV